MLKYILLAVCLTAIRTPAAYAGDFIFGTTFSPRQCEYLGLDWQETYKAILDFPFDIVRLGAYWSEIEKKEDEYDFSELDWLISQVKQRNVQIVLTVGMKAPRWPEYFIPSWALKKSRLRFGATVSKNAYLRERTLKFIEKVVARYRDETLISHWQVENEALNRFGGKHWKMDKYFLAEEIELVRKLDSHHRKIILTASTYPNNFLRILSKIFTNAKPIMENLELCDIMGINIYPLVGHKFWNRGFYFGSRKKGRNVYFSNIIENAQKKNKEIWVTELQAEPWEPGHLVYKHKQKPPTGWPEDTKLILKELRSLGYNTFLLWGTEYWYYQKIKYNNPEWWEMAEEILKAGNQKFTQ